MVRFHDFRAFEVRVCPVVGLVQLQLSASHRFQTKWITEFGLRALTEPPFAVVASCDVPQFPRASLIAEHRLRLERHTQQTHDQCYTQSRASSSLDRRPESETGGLHLELLETRFSVPQSTSELHLGDLQLLQQAYARSQYVQAESLRRITRSLARSLTELEQLAWVVLWKEVRRKVVCSFSLIFCRGRLPSRWMQLGAGHSSERASVSVKATSRA
jgi:hypothetical protein